MTYYRLALKDITAKWSWNTTAVTSLKAVFELLRCYRTLVAQDRIRVFSASSKEELHEQLSRENNGLTSGSVTATQFLQERHLLVPERTDSESQQNSSAQEVQSAATTATWAKDLWAQHVAMTTARATQQGVTLATSSLSPTSINTTGTVESMSTLNQKRLEIELGPGGDHDVPYSFSLPVSMPQVLAWMSLLAKVQRGELEP